MRKRMLSVLLVIVLALALVPTSAFASSVSMTLVQQTTGDLADLDKEFVYYIDHCYIGSAFAGVDDLIEFEINTDTYPNVTTVYHNIYWCATCGDSVIYDDLIPGQKEALFNHQIANRHGNSENYQKLCYKITLKNGEKVEITVKDLGNKKLYIAQEDNYSLSVIANGKEQTFAQKSGISIWEFNPKENDTIILKRTNGKEDTNTNGTSFPDVPRDSEYAKAIEYVSRKKIMVGDDQGKFNPDNIVNRAEMATIVCRVLNQTENLSKSNVFNDVPMEHWANAFISRASTLGIVNGYGDGRFGPSDPVTCEQSVTMIIRSIGESDKADSYGGYPNGYLLVAKEKNLLEGIQVEQEQGMSRGSVAILLYNYYTTLNNPSSSEDGHTHNWATRHIEEVGHKEVQYVTVWTYKCNCGLTWETDHRDDERVLEELDDHMAKTGHGRCVYAYETKPSTIYVVDTPAHDEVFCTSCGLIQ